MNEWMWLWQYTTEGTESKIQKKVWHNYWMAPILCICRNLTRSISCICCSLTRTIYIIIIILCVHCEAVYVTYLVIRMLSIIEVLFCKQEARGALRFCQPTECVLMLMSSGCWWLINQHHLKSTQTEKRRPPWVSALLVCKLHIEFNHILFVEVIIKKMNSGESHINDYLLLHLRQTYIACRNVWVILLNIIACVNNFHCL